MSAMIALDEWPPAHRPRWPVERLSTTTGLSPATRERLARLAADVARAAGDEDVLTRDAGTRGGRSRPWRRSSAPGPSRSSTRGLPTAGARAPSMMSGLRWRGSSLRQRLVDESASPSRSAREPARPVRAIVNSSGLPRLIGPGPRHSEVAGRSLRRGRRHTASCASAGRRRRRVSGSPSSAWRMKLVTTRPSYGSMPGP